MAMLWVWISRISPLGCFSAITLVYISSCLPSSISVAEPEKQPGPLSTGESGASAQGRYSQCSRSELTA